MWFVLLVVGVFDCFLAVFVCLLFLVAVVVVCAASEVPVCWVVVWYLRLFFAWCLLIV